jgi:hypothetical protein
LAWRCPFCVELVDVVAGAEEKIGWIESLRELFRKGYFTNQHRVGVIVDAYLGELSDINSQKTSIYEGVMAPSNVKLIYASADVGGEYLANKLLRGADSYATIVLGFLKSGKAAPNMQRVEGLPFRGRRLIYDQNNP